MKLMASREKGSDTRVEVGVVLKGKEYPKVRVLGDRP